MSKNKQCVNLLMTCVSGVLSKVVIQSLIGSDHFNFKIYGVDAAPISDDTCELLIKTAKVPLGSNAGYLNVILSLVEEWKIDVFWPASDDEVHFVSKNREKFQALDCLVLIGSEDVVTNLKDKCSVYDHLKKADVYVPPYAFGENESDVWQAMTNFGYPQKTVVVKPSAARGNRGLNIFLGHDKVPAWLGNGEREKRHYRDAITSSEQLRGLIENRTIIMPALSDPAYDVDVLGSKGFNPQVVVRKRANPSGIPFTGNEIIADSAIREYCCNIAKVLNLDSLFDMDLLSDSKGVCLLEINPRPSGSLAVSLFAGLPILDAAVADLYGKRIEIVMPKSNLKVYHNKHSVYPLSL